MTTQTLVAMMTFPKQNATRPFRIVLIERHCDVMHDASVYHPFVTWWEATDELGGRMSGNYFETLSDAMKDFRKRCAEPIAYVEGQEKRGEI